MDGNKDEAEMAKNLAQEKMSAGDFVGARKLVEKAQRLFPILENLQQMIAICDVHSSADEKIHGLNNWYGILQVQCYADADTVKKQYRKLTLLLHPDKNKFIGAEAAFKLVGEANNWLSDQSKRSQYDVSYRIHSSLASSGHHSAAANNVAENIETFWTFCQHCAHWCKYPTVLMNTSVRCSKCQKTYMSNWSFEVPPSTGAAASGPDLAGLKEDHATKKRPFLHKSPEDYMAEEKRFQERVRKFMDEAAKSSSEFNERLRKIMHKHNTMHGDYFCKKKHLAASNETEEVNKAEDELAGREQRL